MMEVKIILKDVKKNREITWELDNKECLSVKDNGVTIYDGDGSFRAFYYSENVIGVEVLDQADERG